MRRFAVKAILILLLTLVGIAGFTTVMATEGPLLPGDVLFPIQEVSENLYSDFLFRRLDRAYYALAILEHRVDNFDVLVGTRYEVPALIALDKAIDKFTLAFASLNNEDASVLRQRLSSQIKRIREISRRSTRASKQAPELYAPFSAKIESKSTNLM